MDREVIAQGDRLAVWQRETVNLAPFRHPAANENASRRPRAINGVARAALVMLRIGRQLALVCAPADLDRHARLLDEAEDAPGIDELVRPLRSRCDLRVALADMDDLRAGSACESRFGGR